MKEYIKDGVVKKQNEIMLLVEREVNCKTIMMQHICPPHDLLLANGWTEYIRPIIDDLQKEKHLKKKEIERYDSSKNVNQFSINGISMWLDKATRAGLKLRFEAELAIGKTDTTLWFEDKQFPLPLSMAIQLLYAIEVYASACYDNTQRHLAEVEKLTTLEEIKDYNYKVGYPDKLSF